MVYILILKTNKTEKDGHISHNTTSKQITKY